jgi:hypothetical protein
VPTFWPSRLPYPGEFLGACASRSSAPSIGLRRDFSGSALSCPLAGLASRGCRVRLMLRAGQLFPPKGLLTLGSDAGRFPPTPPACYRASWQLPGPDSHRLADTSLSTWVTSTTPPPFGTGQCPRLLGTRNYR